MTRSKGVCGTLMKVNRLPVTKRVSFPSLSRILSKIKGDLITQPMRVKAVSISLSEHDNGMSDTKML